VQGCTVKERIGRAWFRKQFGIEQFEDRIGKGNISLMKMGRKLLSLVIEMYGKAKQDRKTSEQ
jgi:hypothetical protein